MPTTLLIVYRVLGTVLFALAAAAKVEGNRTVRWAVLLPARLLECRKAGSTSPGAAAGGIPCAVRRQRGRAERRDG